MIIIPFLVFGGLFGALIARRRGGDKFDIAQYVVVNAILFGIIGLIITVILDRTVI